MSFLIKNGDTVLFQGDSVTDAGRDYGNPGDLGSGYPNFIAAWFAALHPEINVAFINRGVSGNRVRGLQARWQKDCLDLRPSWVSILIGINDCWRRYDSGDPTSLEEFADGYRDILCAVRDNTDSRLILCEPFVLPCPEDRKTWREDLDPKINAVRALAREFGAILIPYDGIFASASTKRPPEFWADDGVHPTQPGHALMALEWLKAVGAPMPS